MAELTNYEPIDISYELERLQNSINRLQNVVDESTDILVNSLRLDVKYGWLNANSVKLARLLRDKYGVCIGFVLVIAGAVNDVENYDYGKLQNRILALHGDELTW